MYPEYIYTESNYGYQLRALEEFKYGQGFEDFSMEACKENRLVSDILRIILREEEIRMTFACFVNMKGF